MHFQNGFEFHTNRLSNLESRIYGANEISKCIALHYVRRTRVCKNFPL